MKITITEQIEFMTIIRNSFEGLVAEGVKSTNGMPMEAKLDVSEAILLTLNAYAAYETEISAYLAERGKE